MTSPHQQAGKHVRRKMIGQTKTEMKAKFRDLRRDLDSGAGRA